MTIPSVSAPKPKKQAKQRNRGAQTSNDNATKHGIYSKHFSDDEITRILAPLRDPKTDRLDAVITASHVLLDRTIVRMSRRGLDSDEFSRLASVHNETAGRIAHLIRTQRLITDSSADSLAGHIGAVLDEINEALHAHAS